MYSEKIDQSNPPLGIDLFSECYIGSELPLLADENCYQDFDLLVLKLQSFPKFVRHC